MRAIAFIFGLLAVLPQVAAEPQSAEACHKLGMALRHGGGDRALEDAVVWLEKAVALAPGIPEYLADYGGTCLQIADHRQSWTYAVQGRDAMEKALEMDPSQIDCRYGLMKFFAKAPWPLGDSPKALAQAGAIAHYNPSRGVQACLALERIFERSGQYSDARNACNMAIRIDPANHDAVAILARLATL